MSKQYPIHCPKCGSEMMEHSLSFLDEGTQAEGTDECLNCGFMREYLYGHWREFEREVTDPMAANLVGMYDHLNTGDGHWQLNLHVCQVVELVRKMNYGEHRFMSELIRQRKADPLYKTDSEFKQNTDRLEELINDGYY